MLTVEKKLNSQYVILAITLIYLIIEVAFNFKLLNTLGVYSAPNLIDDIEVIGRSVASLGMVIFLWGTVIPFYRKKRNDKEHVTTLHQVLILIPCFIIIFPLMYTGIGHAIDQWVDSRDSQQREAAIYANLVKEGVLADQITLGDFSEEQFNSPEGQSFNAISSVLYYSIDSKASKYIKEDPQRISQIVYASALKSSANYYGQYQQLVDEVDKLWENYSEASKEYRSKVFRKKTSIKNEYLDGVRELKDFYNKKYKEAVSKVYKKNGYRSEKKKIRESLLKGLVDIHKALIVKHDRKNNLNTLNKNDILSKRLINSIRSFNKNIDIETIRPYIPTFNQLCSFRSYNKPKFFVSYYPYGEEHYRNFTGGPKWQKESFFKNYSRNIDYNVRSLKGNYSGQRSIKCHVDDDLVDKLFYKLLKEHYRLKIGFSPFHQSFESLLKDTHAAKLFKEKMPTNILQLLPKNWKVNDKNTFLKVIDLLVAEQAGLIWEKQVNRYDAPNVEPNLNKSSLLNSDSFQSYLEEKSNGIYYPNMPLQSDPSETQFRKTILKEYAFKQSNRIQSALNSAQYKLNQGEVYGKVGADNVRGVLVPAFSLTLSFIMIFLNSANLFFKLGGFIQNEVGRIYYFAFILFLVSAVLFQSSFRENEFRSNDLVRNQTLQLKKERPVLGRIINLFMGIQPMFYPVGSVSALIIDPVVFSPIITVRDKLKTNYPELFDEADDNQNPKNNNLIMEVEKLYSLALKDIKNNRLQSSKSGQHAIDKINKIKRLDPSSRKASELYKKISERYSQLSAAAENVRNYSLAERHSDNANKFEQYAKKSKGNVI